MVQKKKNLKQQKQKQKQQQKQQVIVNVITNKKMNSTKKSRAKTSSSSPPLIQTLPIQYMPSVMYNNINPFSNNPPPLINPPEIRNSIPVDINPPSLLQTPTAIATPIPETPIREIISEPYYPDEPFTTEELEDPILLNLLKEKSKLQKKKKEKEEEAYKVYKKTKDILEDANSRVPKTNDILDNSTDAFSGLSSSSSYNLSGAEVIDLTQEEEELRKVESIRRSLMGEFNSSVDKYICGCGKEMQNKEATIKRHNESQFHKNWIKDNSIKPAAGGN